MNAKRAIGQEVHFTKYRKYGPYHWSAFSLDFRHRDLFTLARYRLILDCAQIQGPCSIVDMGCGDGALTFLAWQQNRNGVTIGIEPDEVGRQLAAEMLGKRRAGVQLLSTSVPVASASQDYVLCADVIEHVPDDEGFLREIKRILKPGGRVALSTPVRITKEVRDPEHCREYYPDEFCQLVGKQFEVRMQRFCSPVCALELYQWHPRMFRGRPIFGWVMSALSISTGKNLLYCSNASCSYWLTQAIVGIKSDSFPR